MFASAAIGAGSSLASLFGGDDNSASNVQIPTGYAFQNLRGADQQAYGAIQSQGDRFQNYAQVQPQAQAVYQQTQNNPYASNYLQGLQGAQDAYYGAGALNSNNARTLSQQGNSLLGLEGQIYNSAFDPQQALYDRTAQLTTDASRAAQAARGIAMTPYGAGVEGRTLSDFNIDWQNQQLNRQTQGARAIGNIDRQASSDFSQAGNLSGLGAQQLQTGAGLPYGGQQQIYRDQQQGINWYGGVGQAAQDQSQQQISNYLNYLSAGIGAQNSAYSGTGQQLSRSNLAFNQGQTVGNNLGSSLAGLGNNNWGSSQIGQWFNGLGGGGVALW